MTFEWGPQISEGTSFLQIRDESILDGRNNTKTRKRFLVYSKTNGSSIKEARTEVPGGKRHRLESYEHESSHLSKTMEHCKLYFFNVIGEEVLSLVLKF